MSIVEEIKSAISGLPSFQFSELRTWLSETDWESWDSEIETDSDAGKLDFLLDEARTEKSSGHLRNL